jgi:hypothetical protein
MDLFRWKQRKDEEPDGEIQNHLDEALRAALPYTLP